MVGGMVLAGGGKRIEELVGVPPLAGAVALADLPQPTKSFTLPHHELEGAAALAAGWFAPATAAEMDLGPPARATGLTGEPAGPGTVAFGTLGGAFRG